MAQNYGFCAYTCDPDDAEERGVDELYLEECDDEIEPRTHDDKEI